MKVDVLLGLQWGDEGKGKIVDVITPKYDIIARFQGGPNAGHTLEFNGIKHVLHTIPSGIFHDNTVNLIGNGVVIDPIILKKEILEAQKIGANLKENLLISNKAQLILPSHRILDKVYEETKAEKKIGSTLKGIGPAYTDKTARIAVKTGDIFDSKCFIEKYNNAKSHHIKILNGYNYFESFDELEKQWFDAVEFLNNLNLLIQKIM
jgi:adenylosuccinate synthase